MNNNEMYHWGIKGMKWGVRKKRVSSENESDDHKQAQTLQKKHISEMSNKELESLNRRLQLEQTYSNLTRKDHSAARKFATDILTEVGKNAVKDLLTGKEPGIAKGVKKGVDWLRRMGSLNLGGKFTD